MYQLLNVIYKFNVFSKWVLHAERITFIQRPSTATTMAEASSRDRVMIKITEKSKTACFPSPLNFPVFNSICTVLHSCMHSVLYANDLVNHRVLMRKIGQASEHNRQF